MDELNTHNIKEAINAIGSGKVSDARELVAKQLAIIISEEDEEKELLQRFVKLSGQYYHSLKIAESNLSASITTTSKKRNALAALQEADRCAGLAKDIVWLLRGKS